MANVKKQSTTNKINRRREIAICGLKLFCEKGYESTTVDDIMKKANCSHGLFYHYFKSKKEIFDEVMKIKNENHDSKLIQKIESEPLCRNKLKIILKSMFSTMVSDENFPYHYFFFLSRCFSRKQKDCPPPQRPADKKPFISILENIFIEGQQNGEFTNKYTAKECAKLLFSIIQGASLGYVIAPKDIQKQMQPPNIDFILDVFNKGV